MLVDEPELYLHPHACRHFYSVLKALSQSGVHVVCTTHSAAFLDVADYQSIYLVRKEDDKTKVSEGSNYNFTSSRRSSFMASAGHTYMQTPQPLHSSVDIIVTQSVKTALLGTGERLTFLNIKQ